ncbi:hypothetical protein [Thalassobellus suaedae]|uniref:DUF998 domain-containing protein n=1 Tax=Thalassobellus suaedae TaxID=3074124 RepID=A0ABY9Y1U1_9FLAO|nr:hypothetical protein RHP49_14995 [Flavobacteriaceae bacterium HL-DH10]
MNIIISEIIKIKQKLNKDKIPHFIVAIYILVAFLLCGVFYINKKFNIPFEKLTGDPALIFKSHPFIGFLSNIGILLWCFTASICYFSGIILFKVNDTKKSLFFLSSGLFTSILLIDDFFMFHDYIFYSFESFKIVQPITFAIYAMLLLWYIIKFYKIILDSVYVFLALAVGFLGLSVLIDLIFESSGLEYFIEDGFKFIGIINWMLFFSITAYQTILTKLK